MSWNTILVANVNGPCARGRLSHQSTGWEPPTTAFISNPRRQVEPPVVTLVGVSRDYPSIPPSCWSRYDFTQGLSNHIHA